MNYKNQCAVDESVVGFVKRPTTVKASPTFFLTKTPRLPKVHSFWVAFGTHASGENQQKGYKCLMKP